MQSSMWHIYRAHTPCETVDSLDVCDAKLWSVMSACVGITLVVRLSEEQAQPAFRLVHNS